MPEKSYKYYPYGLQTANSWTRENATGNNYLANGGTELNNTSQLYDLDYRNYDPILGRMNQVDPMADSYSSLTPYNFAFNDPVTFNDPSGADPFSREDYWTELSIQNRAYANNYIHQQPSGMIGGSSGSLFDQTWSGGFNGIGGIGLGSAAQQMNSDARNLSAQEYGQKYGESYELKSKFEWTVSNPNAFDRGGATLEGGRIWYLSPNPNDPFNVSGIPSREPYSFIGYLWTGGFENGVHYDRDGNPTSKGWVMGEAPDVGLGKGIKILTNLHHSFPKFLGGLKNPKKLTEMTVDAHKALHKELNIFLSKFGMTPSRANPGRLIRQNNTPSKIEKVLTDFYNGPGAKYTEAAKDFFKYLDDL